MKGAQPAIQQLAGPENLQTTLGYCTLPRARPNGPFALGHADACFFTANLTATRGALEPE